MTVPRDLQESCCSQALLWVWSEFPHSPRSLKCEDLEESGESLSVMVEALLWPLV